MATTAVILQLRIASITEPELSNTQWHHRKGAFQKQHTYVLLVIFQLGRYFLIMVFNQYNTYVHIFEKNIGDPNRILITPYNDSIKTT